MLRLSLHINWPPQNSNHSHQTCRWVVPFIIEFDLGSLRIQNATQVGLLVWSAFIQYELQRIGNSGSGCHYFLFNPNYRLFVKRHITVICRIYLCKHVKAFVYVQMRQYTIHKVSPRAGIPTYVYPLYHTLQTVHLRGTWKQQSTNETYKFRTVFLVLCCNIYLRYTNPGCQETKATKFCTLAPNISGSLARNMLYITLLEPRIVRLKDFWKIGALHVHTDTTACHNA
jgi:hypothetical protein